MNFQQATLRSSKTSYLMVTMCQHLVTRPLLFSPLNGAQHPPCNSRKPYKSAWRLPGLHDTQTLSLPCPVTPQNQINTSDINIILSKATICVFVGAMVTILDGWPCSLLRHLPLETCSSQLLRSYKNQQAPTWMNYQKCNKQEKKMIQEKLEDTAHYAGFLLAPADGF